MLRLCRLSIWLAAYCFCLGALGQYHEKLDITPLDPFHLLAAFQFKSNVSSVRYQQQHFDLLPRSLSQILQHNAVHELHLRFSTGRWNSRQWGRQPFDGRHEGGTGVEIWAWIEARDESNAFSRWTSLNHALSGLFCASMNFIDATRTTRPVNVFQATSHNAARSRQLHLLHGALPHEVVCTENLTPFLKLLPCKGNAGIGALLGGHKLFDAAWQTMSVDLRTICNEAGQDCVIEMAQSIDMVLNVDRAKRLQYDPIPRPVPRENLLCNDSKPYAKQDACFPSEARKGQSWVLSEIFGRKIPSSCLSNLAIHGTPANVCLLVPKDRQIVNPGDHTETDASNQDGRCWSLEPSKPFEIILSHLGPQTYNAHSAPSLGASRSLLGHGQERGSIQTTLQNFHSESSLDIVYFESLPWFMKPYLHTLRAQVSSQTDNPRQSPQVKPSLINQTIYRPALDRRRGTHLELALSVPASSTVTISYDFDKAILRYTEYPPDPNRGFDVAAAVIRVAPSSERHSAMPIYVRTTNLLLPLPTPDFSMPYNVIILTSTVMALAFGSIYNLLVRRFVAADECGPGILMTVKAAISAKMSRLRAITNRADDMKKKQ